MNKKHHIAIYIAVFAFAVFQILKTDNVKSQSIPQITHTTITVGSTAYNVVAYVPTGATGNLPTFVFLPGLGERGTGSGNIDELYANGPLGFIRDNNWRPDFVVIGIQPNDGWASINWVHSMLNSVIANSSFHVDSSKLYLTGLSAGAFNILEYIRDHASPVNISAIIPMSYTWNASASDTRYANIRVWGLAGSSDSHYAKLKAFVESLAASGYDAKFTTYSGGHCCWSTYYNPSWTENGKNIYDWALNTGTPPPSNSSPSANAGTDQSITLPTSSVTLSGSGSDSDGSISSYAWTKTSGGTATITSASSASTTVTGLAQGTYTFQLQVTDNGGATATDSVSITVNAASSNGTLSSSAGGDQTITLPTSSVSLSGSAGISSGSLPSVTYAWTKTSGGTATITSASSASTSVTGLVAGSYTFRLTISSSGYADATDDVSITVNSAGSGNTSSGTTPPSITDGNDHYLIDFGPGSSARTLTTGWNNITSASAGTTTTLVKTTGASSSASVTVTDAFLNTNNTGTNSSTIYPITATDDSLYLGTLSGVTDNQGVIRISGLSDIAHTFTFYASRVANDGTDRTAQYTIGSTSATLNATDNVDNIVSILNVTPVNGIVDITVTKIGTYGYIGVLQIDVNSSGGTPPPTPGNASPSANAGTDQSITLPTSSVTLSGSGSDSDGSISSYAWTKTSGGSATITSSSSASTSVTGLAQGTYTFQLQVTDNGGATASDTMTVTVNAAAGSTSTSSGTTPPSITDGNDHYLIDFGSSGEKTTTTGWNNIFSAAVNTTANLVKTTGATSSATATITDAFGNTNSAGTSSNNTYPATATDDSLYLGTISGVTDNTGVIRIAGLSDTPHTFTFFASRVANDGVNRTAQYTIGSTSATLNATDNTNNIVSILNITPTNGIVDITVTNIGTYAYIGVLQIDSGTSSGTPPPTPGNVSPTVNAGQDQTIVLPTTSVTLSGSGSDSDGSISTYAWTKTSGGTATITSASSASTTVTGLAQGTYTFQLQVTDNGGATATDTVNIIVSATSNATTSSSTTAPSINDSNDHYLIDFGSTSFRTTTTPWNNNITSAAAGTTATLVKTSGVSSSVTATITDAFNSVNTVGTTTNSSYPTTATQDSIFLSTVSVGGVTDSQGVIRISGLSNVPHTFTFFGSRMASGDGVNRTAQYAIGSASITLNATDNVNNLVSISNVIPTNGIVDITVTSVGTYAYLGVIQIDSTTSTASSGSCSAKKIVVLGSSTAAGNGASPTSNGWVGLFTTWFQQQNPSNTVTNYGTSTYTTYHILPTGTSIPAGRPATDVNKNMTKALSLNPNGIIINMPTNDTNNGYPLSEQQANFTLLANTAISANVPVWVTTTQPRNISTTGKNNLIAMRDWIQTTFPQRYLDFWSTIALSDGSIDPTYDSGDGIHVNNAGHAILAQRAQNSNVLSVLCSGAGAGGPITPPPTPGTNIAPTVNAGTDQTINLPTNSITLAGSAIDSDGSIATYSWTQITGGSATITSSSSASTSVTGLAQGTYTFQLQVTDNGGATATDTISITVNNAIFSSGRTIMLTVGATSKQIYSLTAGVTYGIQPGDRLVIPKNKEIISLMLTNFGGTPEAPVVIEMEDPSTSTIGGYGGYAFNIQNASNFIIRNVVVDGKGTSGYGMSIGNGTSNYTVENVTIRNTGSGQGLIAKWNPVAGDASTAYPNTIDNVTLRNIYVENTGTEGFYIGNTGSALPAGMTASPIVNLIAENLTSNNTGWDGIQITTARNIQAKNLKATNFGTKDARGQQAGLQIGGSTSGSIDGFEATNGTGAGLALFGRGLFTIKNGTITNVATTSTEHGMYVDDYAEADLPPLQLNFDNININGATNNPIYIKNTNSTMIPGVLKDIFYQNVGTGKKIFDASNSQIVGGTELGATPPPPPNTNTFPTANAGLDQSITMPTSTVTLIGIGADAQGPVTYTWTKTSGGNATILSPNSATTLINSLAQGTYTFRLSVTDNGGLVTTDDVNVIVNAPNIGVNRPPFVSLQSTHNVVLPSSSITINTSISDPDGDALAYIWSQTSGPTTAVLSGKFAAILTASSLSLGTYTFSVLVTDSNGASTVGSTQVLVTTQALPAATGQNQQPTTNQIKEEIPSDANKNTTAGIGTATVNAAKLNMRSAPINGQIINSLSRNDSVTILAKQGEWYKVLVGDTEGWVSGTYLKNIVNTDTSTTKSSTTTASSGTARVLAKTLNVRTSPISGAVISKVTLNSKITIISSKNGWTQVKLSDGQIGWVSSQYIVAEKTTTTTTPKTSSGFTAGQNAKTTASVLKVRSTPNGEAVTSVAKGTAVTVIKQSGEWVNVYFADGTTGYVSAKYLAK